MGVYSQPIDQERMHILSTLGRELLQDHLLTYRLFVVDFYNPLDPFFVSKEVSQCSTYTLPIGVV
jgi:hypothetical protein